MTRFFVRMGSRNEREVVCLNLTSVSPLLRVKPLPRRLRILRNAEEGP